MGGRALFAQQRVRQYQLTLARWKLPIALVFLAAAGLGQLELQRMRQQHPVLVDEIKSLDRQLQAPVSLPAPSRAAPLPPADDVRQVAADLQSIAAEHGLAVSDVSFSPSLVDGSSKAQQIAITVHMKGSYSALKKALSALLWSHETLALDRLSLRRGDPMSGHDINLSLSFFCSRK